MELSAIPIVSRYESKAGHKDSSARDAVVMPDFAPKSARLIGVKLDAVAATVAGTSSALKTMLAVRGHNLCELRQMKN